MKALTIAATALVAAMTFSIDHASAQTPQQEALCKKHRDLVRCMCVVKAGGGVRDDGHGHIETYTGQARNKMAPGIIDAVDRCLKSKGR